MKKLLLAILLTIGFVSNAQTIHWLTFIDTTDKDVGQCDVTGRKILYDHFVNIINSALAEKGYKSNIQDIYGSALSPEKCRQLVQQLQCGENDIVMFYYIGHGTHGVSGNGDLPLMLLGVDGDQYNRFVPLAWVHKQLKQKNPRLLATIGMCCNAIQQFPRGIDASYSPNYGNTYLTNQQKKAVQKMFLETKGDIVVASASPGQLSSARNTPFGVMDIFTAALVVNFEAYMAEGELAWIPLFNAVRQVINQISGGEQTPFFKHNLTACSAPSPVTRTRPVEVKPTTQNVSTSESTSNADGLQMLNDLAQSFDFLISTQQPEEKRISYEQSLNRIFASDAVVRVMSQDGNYVVDRSSAKDFLGRLATSRILLKVIPISVTVKDGKITSLKVKETYNK